MSAPANLKLSETSVTRPALLTVTAKTPSGSVRVVFFQYGQELATV